jgi:hypothetical protein
MDIIERKFALAHNESKYYTGIPCKNGHLAMRYTKSGACQECIHGVRTPQSPSSNPAAVAAQAEKDQRRAEAVKDQKEQKEREALRSEYKNYVAQFKFFVPDRNWPDFRTVAVLLTQMRYPELTADDIASAKSRKSAIGVGVSLYVVAVHPDDRAALISISEEMSKAVSQQMARDAAANIPGSLFKEDILTWFNWRGGILMAKNPADVEWFEDTRRILDWWYKYSDLELTVKGNQPYAEPIRNAKDFVPVTISKIDLVKEIGPKGENHKEFPYIEPRGDEVYGALQIVGNWYRVDQIKRCLDGFAMSVASLEY